MDTFTRLFWMFFLLFNMLSVYLLYHTKGCIILYLQITCGFGMFITSKIGRKFLGIL